MSESLINSRRLVELKTPRESGSFTDRTDDAEPEVLWVSVTDEAEHRFIVRSVLWMMSLAVVPLILLYVVCYFCPDLLQVPATSIRQE
ncbi:hypothetical protein Mal4_02530 [Maioricimonas rarisocia]|uniref:Uncharacterized protein n=1 Tax=Maioricimonas rarisocia TaxID=2528026 RepID=A0A517Z0F1_9PLAN|nr:hypothetical protein [Maioricimonas rarisocia]QDU35970.1 hypothetical protein Mal4_02530 [Maioricimonas rarisocia]